MNVVADARPSALGIVLRGDNRKLISAPEHEVVLSGPSDTGKSVSCCVKLHLLAMRYPGENFSMMRKTAASVAGTVGQTFMRVVKGTKGAPIALGGSTPSRFIYENGSQIWVGGLDKAEKVLSGERGAIYVCQAEQLTVEDWEMLSRTCSGRGSKVRCPQLFADANPGGSKHWIREREKAGKLRLLRSRHEDNPTLYGDDGALLDSDDARRRIKTLQELTGVRYKRLYQGLWVTAEGAVYENFDATPGKHVVARSWSEMKRAFVCVDEGFTNPAVALLVGEDGDGRWHVFEEFHRTSVLPEDHVKAIVGYWESSRRAGWQGPPVELVAVDESAAGLIASLKSLGVNAKGGKGRVEDGIRALQDRMAFQADGKPRFTIDAGCGETINELESYRWNVTKSGQAKDVPVKQFDHGMDALRYLCDALSEPSGAFTAALIAGTSLGANATPSGPIGAPRVFVPRRLG